MKNNSILIVGTVALDTVKTPLGKEKDVLGGSATYAAISASFFGPVNLVAVVGADFPRRHLETLQNRGINLKGLQSQEGKTFRWEGEYGWDFSDPRTLDTQLNVLAGFDPQIPREYRGSKYVFLANVDPQIQKRVLQQVDKPGLVVCDTMNYWIKNKRKDLLSLLKLVDVFLLNESEAKMITGELNVVKVGQALLKLGPRIVAVKKGEHGALLFMKNSMFCIPAFLLEALVDPTGAGDTFAGGFIGYLANSKGLSEASLRRALVYGSVMATFTVEDFSIRRLISITKKDISERFRQFKELVEF